MPSVPSGMADVESRIAILEGQTEAISKRVASLAGTITPSIKASVTKMEKCVTAAISVGRFATLDDVATLKSFANGLVRASWNDTKELLEKSTVLLLENFAKSTSENNCLILKAIPPLIDKCGAARAVRKRQRAWSGLCESCACLCKDQISLYYGYIVCRKCCTHNASRSSMRLRLSGSIVAAAAIE